MTKRALRNRRAELRAVKRQQQIEKEKNVFELVKAAMQSPVLSGVLAFFMVSGIESLQSKASTISTTTVSTASTPKGIWGSFASDFEKFFNISAKNLIPGVAIIESITSNSNTLANVDYTALKAVILVYIASGGNLAGLLASGQNFLGPAAVAASG